MSQTIHRKIVMEATLPEYNVFCRSCGSTWQPEPRSPLWWRAHQRAQKGFLDAPSVEPERCGCVRTSDTVSGTGQYKVFGFDALRHSFEHRFESFVEAVKAFKRLNSPMSAVSISGVSPGVERRLT